MILICRHGMTFRLCWTTLLVVVYTMLLLMTMSHQIAMIAVVVVVDGYQYNPVSQRTDWYPPLPKKGPIHISTVTINHKTRVSPVSRRYDYHRRNEMTPQQVVVLSLSSANQVTPNNNNEQQSDGKKGRRRKGGGNKFRLPIPIQSFLLQTKQRLVVKLRNSQWTKYIVRFQTLSRRSKLIILFQCLVLFGGIGNTVMNRMYHHRPSPQLSQQPPIEISYSSFLDIIEQKAGIVPPSLGNHNNINIITAPKIDQVRIASDRIMYRLYNSNSNAVSSQPSTTTATTSSSTKALTTNLELATATTIAKQRPRLLPVLTIKPRQKTTPAPPQPSYIRAYTKKVAATPELIHQLRSNDISFAAASVPRTASSTLAVAARTLLVGCYFIILFRLYRTISGSGIGGGPNKNDAVGKLVNRNSDLPLATFDEVQGIDTAKLEVMELVDVLRNPDKYAILGARAPTGLLLVGPPGTGKTMLARATAATAGVPLLYCSGSDFVEMFVGRGAARVRQLFDRATKLAPCIIFIDEVDALGKSRDFGGGFGNGLMSRSNDEAEQTLNQLLACMDGLDSSRQVCVLAATNRKEVLDPALIRPGRFDRIVKLELPNAYGREQILRVHASKLPGFVEGSGLDVDRMNALGKGRMVDLSAIAAVTDGWSGAELEFLVNEAAIRAVRRVSSALQQGTTPLGDIVPHVEARDFEESLRSFYETRKPRGSGPSAVNDLLKNVWK